MSRLTISLDDELHQSLKEAAARQNRSISSIVGQSLWLRGIGSLGRARDLIARALATAGLGAGGAMALAAAETRRARKRR